MIRIGSSAREGANGTVAWTEAARAFLTERRFATLTTVGHDGTPRQTVTWYDLRGDQVATNSTRRRQKDRILLLDPRISIRVEDEDRTVAVAKLVEDHILTRADLASLADRDAGAERAAAMVRDSFSRRDRVAFLLPVANADVRGFED